MAFQDKTLVCKECGNEFVFTAGEQEFYAEKGFENEPTRCKACRDARKQRMSDGRRGGSRQMYEAVCADCGAPTQVPFKPRNDRPVYCSACYQNHRMAQND
jgi:CxxC-x17-CxxC domain-containing protein